MAVAFLRSRALLPALFLLLVGPAVLIQVFLTPPLQVPDEQNHLLRASQLRDGRLFGQILPGGAAGGILDPLLPVFANAFDAMKAHPQVKVDPAVYAAASAMRWRTGADAPCSFINTAPYPFFLYLPASVGLAIGRGAHLSIMDSFYLGRLLTAVASLAFSGAALLICGHGRALLFLLLSLPMTTSLFASVSQDAMSIAFGAIGAAAWSSHAARGAAMPPGVRAGVALAFGAVVAARLPLAPLYILAVMPTRRPERMGRARPGDVVAGLVGLLPIAFGLYGAHLAKVPFRVEDGVSAAAQIGWIAHHPLQAAHVAVASVSQDANRLLREFVGTLGWLDTVLPPFFHRAMWICGVLAIVLDCSTPRACLGRWAWLPVIAVAIVVAGVFGALYLIYTPVGSPLVEGVQGRYFLVPALVFAVSLPGRAPPRWLGAHGFIDLSIAGARAALCATVAMIELWTVPVVLIHRYYG